MNSNNNKKYSVVLRFQVHTQPWLCIHLKKIPYRFKTHGFAIIM